MSSSSYFFTFLNALPIIMVAKIHSKGVHVFFFGFGAQEYTLGDETEEGWPRGGFIA